MLLPHVIAFLVLSPALAAAQPAPADAPRAPPVCPGFREDAALGPACPGPDGVRVLLRDGRSLLVHGEPHEAFVAATAPSFDVRSAPARAPRCVADPATEAHTRVLYVVPSDATDRLASYLPVIQDAVLRANGFLAQEAGVKGHAADILVRCRDGAVAIDGVVLPTPFAQTTISSVASDLRALGYESPLAKMWVFYDAWIGGAGYASLAYDDRLVAENANNKGAMYALVNVTGGALDPATALHELMHTMGAVQKSAPHTTGAGHCHDVRDVMCYKDGGPTSTTILLCSDRIWLDCNHDDYWDPAPPAGSYLATHWNVASPLNRFLAVAPLAGDGLPATEPEPEPSPAPAAPAPDLVAGALEPSLSAPTEGDLVTWSLPLTNAGGDAAGFTVRFTVDGALLGEVRVAGLAAGATVRIASPAWAAAPGLHEIAARADAADELAEANESDNAAATTVDAAPRPPLRAVALGPEHQSSAKSRVTYTLTVTNAGEATDTFALAAGTAQGWKVTLSTTSVTLAPGGTATFTLSLAASKGATETAFVPVTATSLSDPGATARATTETTRR